MKSGWVRPACIALAAFAWAVDLVTPQLFVVAILLNVPIALSSLELDPRFTRWLVFASLLADATAGYVNGAHDGYNWSAIAIGDRLIAALSFLLVGTLSVQSQRAAAKAGELAARQERAARERTVRRAVESIRSSVNPELIHRAIVREALASFGADVALLYAFEPNLDEPTTYRMQRDRAEVVCTGERPASPVLSFLHRIAESRELVVLVDGSDAFGRLLLDSLGADHALAALLVEHDQTFGALVLLRKSASNEDRADEALGLLAAQSAIALAQAALFVKLGERNAELGAANAALRERSDVIRDLVYALSHDLRTPLAAAGMTMRQALEGAYGALPEAYLDILRRSIASNDELQRLAETLLLVSRYESGERSRDRVEVDLAGITSDVVAELEPLWRRKNLRVEPVTDAHPVVSGDEVELRRAILNLVANAVTWTPAGNAIAVRVEVNGDAASVVVEDEGYGVPAEERTSLFQRLRPVPARRGAGSGLGLYLVRLIAESHGGTVSFSPRPERGSIFTLTLPLQKRPVPV